MCGVPQACAVFCRWLMIGNLIMAIILSSLTASSCHFLNYDHGDNGSGSAGLYRFLAGTECVDYQDDRDFDDMEQKARGAAVVAPIAGSFALLLIIIEFCLCRFPCSRLFIGCSLLLAQIMQGLTFLFFASETFCDGDLVEEITEQKPCVLSTGSVFSIVAIILYFFCGAVVFCTRKPEPMAKRHYSQEALPDSNTLADDEPEVSKKTPDIV